MRMISLFILPAITLGCVNAHSVDETEKPTPAAASRTFLVPKQLRLDHGQVVFHRGDAERLRLNVSAGVYLGTIVVARSHGNDLWDSVGGVIEPDSPNVIEDRTLPGYEAPPGPVVYTIEIFETPERIGHMWFPGGPGYRVLWTRSFEIAAGTEQPPATRPPASAHG